MRITGPQIQGWPEDRENSLAVVRRAVELGAAFIDTADQYDNRSSEAVLDYCTAHGIAFIPWFPIGGGEMKGDEVLEAVADRHGVSRRQVALAWLLHHADNILLIPGTSSVPHVEDNLAVGAIDLTGDDLAALDAIAAP